MACSGRKELWGSDFEINKGQAAFFFERRETAKSLPCALMDETQKGHLTFPRETNLSALWTRQLMCLETNYIFFFPSFEQVPGGFYFETFACLERPRQDGSTACAVPLHAQCPPRRGPAPASSLSKTYLRSRATLNATFSMISPVSPSLIHHCVISESFL